jgi:alpha-glucosidase
MHDGQNLFDDTTAFGGHSWGVARQWNNPGQPQVIVVAIENGGVHRFEEYSPYPGDARAERLIMENQRKYGMEAKVPDYYGGAGNAYLAWIVEELKPFIDATYRTMPGQTHTSIIGSSMGGLISFYAGLLYPKVFGGVGVISPAFWFGLDHAVAALDKYRFTADQRVYMSVGTAEQGIANPSDYLDDFLLIREKLRASQVNLNAVIHEGAIHNEVDWEPQLPEITNLFL